jgi:hypothetical protein
LKDQLITERNKSIFHLEQGYTSITSIQGQGDSSMNDEDIIALESYKKKPILQIEYLRKLILKLEDQQSAESIKYVVDCQKGSDIEGTF